MIVVRSRAWWRATLALCLGSLLVFLNLYVPQPLLPLMREAYGISTLVASLAMSVSTLSLAAALLVFGPLSDAIGRAGIMRLTLLLAGLLSVVLACVAALAPNFELLLVLRAVQGFVLGGLPAVAIAWMGDEFEKPALLSAVGLYIGANTLGGIGGRVIGGTVAEVGGISASFLTVGCLTLVGVVVFWRLLPPARCFQARRFRLREARAGLAAHLRNPMLVGAYLLGGLNFLIFINQYSYITFRLAQPPFELGEKWLGLLFLTYLSGTFGSALSGRLSRSLSQPACMAFGILLLMLGTAVTLADRLPLILAGLTVNAFGFFLAHSMASSWVGRHAEQDRGSASALYLVFYYTGASLGGFWLEPFWWLGEWMGVVLGSWLVLAGTFAIACWLRRGERRRAAVNEPARAGGAVQGGVLASASSPQISSRRSERPQADL
ncbi:MFS transporter [Halomonas caseinilytica]|uniref:MFS transporter, YNFM family, putative membrane transport protein n=1 Tax=Halomonas caseinilytica TaxID=438744 RepID=A0A1M6N4X8_9GAMM|nr:MFS transporter [Halomonas caseinilytica]SHJ90702.1 MFS transporter, YNFM family, putative membrane transport protein [Halomonas caseinilytica]